MDGIPLAILRTTACTALATMIAHFVLERQCAKRPVVHRMVWCLVLVQGWRCFPSRWRFRWPLQK